MKKAELSAEFENPTNPQSTRTTRSRTFRRDILTTLDLEPLKVLKTSLQRLIEPPDSPNSTPSSLSSTIITFSSSAFISRYKVPKLSFCLKGKGIEPVEGSYRRFSQRMVAAPSWYESKSPKIDTVMVEDGQTPPTKIKKILYSSQGTFSCQSCSFWRFPPQYITVHFI